jgi:hypothetical protein
MTLLEEIQAKCTPEQIAEGNYHIIADIVNVGRVKPNKVEIGNGTILEVFGLTLGTQVLDAVYNTPAFKYVIPLLEQGRLQIGSDVAQAAVQSMVSALLTQEQADKLKNLGFDANPTNWQACNQAVDEGK